MDDRGSLQLRLRLSYQLLPVWAECAIMQGRGTQRQAMQSRRTQRQVMHGAQAECAIVLTPRAERQAMQVARAEEPVMEWAQRHPMSGAEDSVVPGAERPPMSGAEPPVMRTERPDVPDAAESLMAKARPVRPATIVPAAEHPVVAPVRCMRSPAAMADLAEVRAEPIVAGKEGYTDRRRWQERHRLRRRRLRTDLVDRDVTDHGGVVAQQFVTDGVSLSVDVDVGVDQIGLVRSGALGRCGLGLLVRIKRCFRCEFRDRVFPHALNAVNLRIVTLLFAGLRGGWLDAGRCAAWRGLRRGAGRQIAWAFRRTERVAGGPDELVDLAQVDLTGRRISEAERDAAGAIGANEGRAILLAVVESDLVTPDRTPGAGLIEFVAQRARLMRCGKRIFFGETKVAHSAALGDEQDRPIAAGRERNIARRMAVAGARNIFRSGEEVRQHEFVPDIGDGKRAVRPDADRPDRIALVIFGSAIPGSVVECRTAPDRVIQTHLARAFGAHAKPPDSAARGGDIPAFRRGVEARRAVGNAGLAARIERDGGPAARLLALRVAEICAALRAVVEEAAIAAGDSDPVDPAGLDIRSEELLVRLV